MISRVLRVQRAERLVHQQHVGIDGQRSRDPDPLAHAARQLVRVVALEALQTDQPSSQLARLAAGSAGAC